MAIGSLGRSSGMISISFSEDKLLFVVQKQKQTSHVSLDFQFNFCDKGPSIPVVSPDPIVELRAIPRLTPSLHPEERENTNDMEARKGAPPTLTSDFYFQGGGPGSTSGEVDQHRGNIQEGCKRGGTSGAQDMELEKNAMEEGLGRRRQKTQERRSRRAIPMMYQGET
ncbi:hypothetical protein NDU88_010069 [Pleurodeles waltl]|uniref:Uncharacterized protein n=1 Tax=Pleurodeles waltl TaxID=8319 RepID=A0AAV7PTV0_PLEWA|nr:hypothetical protein NDU88_010069 [Pleurodeles waltl]